ncbi:TrmB family transcriptional regulator [Halomicrobium mukohataei]|uniref:TrmB family transcriptional regulator n=1 Tax=Halomicrobium mukohataei TaxID=57705 RepID=A0A847TZY2_9EURY|nr:TrmB family transcriptional regulator [Halomicrobium mukohataei]NLV11562.1 TrmB family transcriptional regulator [Halomicrobium mukohataei]
MGTSDEHDDEQLRDELSVFGLSDTEIDTYLALLACGEASTSTVSETTDVTQRAVYNIAERLEGRGLVRVNDHASPTTIRALPPAEAIENLSDRLDSIRPSLEARFNETTPETPEIQMIKSRETALKRIESAISAARQELLLAVPEHVFPEIESELRTAVDSDVVVFLLIGGMDEVDGDGSEFAGIADVVRYWGESLPLVYTVDDAAAMIGDSTIVSGTHTDDVAVTVSEPQLSGSILGMYFSAYWPAATELYVTDPDPLPRSYDWFRQATLHATLHEQAGVDLHAEVETESGTTVAGPITEIRQAFIEPTSNDFTLENSFFIDTGDGIVSVGGKGSFIEDYQSRSVRLRRLDAVE